MQVCGGSGNWRLSLLVSSLSGVQVNRERESIELV